MKIAIVTTYPPSKGSLNEYAYHLVQQMKHKSEIKEIVIISDQLEQGKTSTEETGEIKVTLRPVWRFNAPTIYIA